MAKKTARLAALPEDYKGLGLSKEPALWEDGHRKPCVAWAKKRLTDLTTRVTINT